MPIIVGIDYSMNSPAVCVFDTDKHSEFKFENTNCHFIAQTKQQELYQDPNIKGHSMTIAKSPEHRYNILANWAFSIFTKKTYIPADAYQYVVTIEGYSFSSSGLVFNIAENTAILKHMLWRHQMTYNVVPPTVIKKFATSKGNANKDSMYESFCKETNMKLTLKERLSPKSNKISSPVSDIVDAYYICKYTYQCLIDDASKKRL